MNVHTECWALGKEIHWAQVREEVCRSLTFCNSYFRIVWNFKTTGKNAPGLLTPHCSTERPSADLSLNSNCTEKRGPTFSHRIWNPRLACLFMTDWSLLQWAFLVQTQKSLESLGAKWKVFLVPFGPLMGLRCKSMEKPLLDPWRAKENWPLYWL